MFHTGIKGKASWVECNLKGPLKGLFFHCEALTASQRSGDFFKWSIRNSCRKQEDQVKFKNSLAVVFPANSLKEIAFKSICRHYCYISPRREETAATLFRSRPSSSRDNCSSASQTRVLLTNATSATWHHRPRWQNIKSPRCHSLAPCLLVTRYTLTRCWLLSCEV